MGYSFMGDRPITGLTRQEELSLQLGFLVEQDQQAEAQKHGPGGRRKYSSPAKSTSQAMAEMDQKVQQANA